MTTELIQFEYKIMEPWVNVSGVTEEEFLNDMGKEGWQLVSVERIQRVAGVRYYFKRPIIQSPDKQEL